MTSAHPELTETEVKILSIEKLRWKYTGTKEQRIREDLDMSMTRYHQVLNAMLDDPRVEAAAPIDVRRLHRLRENRSRAGSGRRLGFA